MLLTALNNVLMLCGNSDVQRGGVFILNYWIEKILAVLHTSVHLRLHIMKVICKRHQPIITLIYEDTRQSGSHVMPMDVCMDSLRQSRSLSRILRCSSWLCGHLCRLLCLRWCLACLPQTSCDPLLTPPSPAAARWSTCEWERSPCSAAECAAPSSISYH